MIRLPGRPSRFGAVGADVTDPCATACSDQNKTTARNTAITIGVVGVIAGIGLAYYAAKHAADPYDSEGFYTG